MNWRKTITLDPAILAGKPVIRGMRISVEQVLRSLGSGVSEMEILADYPDLTADDLQACLNYAADLVGSERVYPVAVGA